jgi:hypothetical protein
MSEYTTNLALKHDGTLYEIGSTVELTDAEAAPLLKVGAVVLGPAGAEAPAKEPASGAPSKIKVPDLIPPGGPAPGPGSKDAQVGTVKEK